MFIVPCKFDANNPIIFECIKKIKQHHPDDKILVVDSGSSDKSYFDKIDCEVLDADNVNYVTNAFYLAFQKYPNEDFYYCIHDTLLVNSSMKQFESKPLSVLRYFSCPPEAATIYGAEGTDADVTLWANAELQKHVGISIPNNFYGVFGPIFFAQNNVIKELENSGFFNIICQIKWHMCGMERLLGIVLSNLGYNIADNSIQGVMNKGFYGYENTFAEKVHQFRQ